MTVPTRTLTQTIRHSDDALEDACSRVGLTVDQYRRIRLAMQFLGAAIVAAAWFTPAVEPSPTAYLVFAALILGPSTVEAYLTRNQ